MKIFAILILAAVLLCGCDTGSVTRDEGMTTGLINPYPPGAATPFFFRSASDWLQYAGEKSVRAHPTE